MRRLFLHALALALAVSVAPAQELTFGGEVRPRFEIRDLVGVESPTTEFTSMRTRVSLGVALASNVSAFVQLQDVRVFGEEGGTLGDYSADGLDLHQGWVELGDAAKDLVSIRVGRQEAAYGGQRLMGAVNWAQQGRSFDGARVRYRPAPTVVVDGLAFRISAASASATDTNESLYGLYSRLEAAGALDLYGLLNTRSSTTTERDLYTLGGRWVANTGPLSWRVEGAYQGGRSETPLADRDIAAFMFGSRVGAEVADGGSITVWYDYLSGDNAPADGTTRVFDTLFATGHKFFGYMDFFIDIPAHTNQRGLQDIALKGSYTLAEGHVVHADLHSFHVAAADGLASGHIGEELDVTYRWAYATGVAITGGASYFLPASDSPAGLRSPTDDQVWGYLMLDVQF